MTVVSISDAARLADVTRSTIYDRINSGVLSRTPEGIDVAELARVYPDLQPLENVKIKHVKKRGKGGVDRKEVSSELLDERLREIEYLQTELNKRTELIAKKDAQLQQANDRLYEKDENWQQRLDAMRSDFQRLLEAPPKRKKIFGIF